VGLNDNVCLKVIKYSGNGYSIISAHTVTLDLAFITATADKGAMCIAVNNPITKNAHSQLQHLANTSSAAAASVFSSSHGNEEPTREQLPHTQ